MKKISLFMLSAAMVFAGCSDKKKPGSVYMPDMAYSRGYETYAMRDSMKFTTDPANKGGNMIYYNGAPAAGTVKRGEMFAYTLPNDSAGYAMSANTKNPIDSLGKDQLAEAGRLYNINCAICHGEKGGGNGPLSAKIGAIANLTLPVYVSMADGTMFHSITYGKNNMGSYASQLTRKQRWEIIHYIRTLQPKAAAANTAATDSTGSKGV
jgi:mono/diheme cytochrome c family protein